MSELKAVRFVDKSRMRILVARSFEKMGIQGKPIGAGVLQKQMAASGIKPEDNLFSSALIRMREE
jgi:hypothetical protein